MAVVARIAPNDIVLKAMDKSVSNWLPIPSVWDVIVDEIAKFAVEQYNIQFGGHYTFNNVDCGWYVELSGGKFLVHLHVVVTDFLGGTLKIEVVVSVGLDIFDPKNWNLEAFNPLAVN